MRFRRLLGSCLCVSGVFACAHAGPEKVPSGQIDGGDPGDDSVPGIEWVGPEPLFVPRGSTATLVVNLDGPVGSAGALLEVGASDPSGLVVVPASVMIPAGETSGEVVVSGLTLGGPIELTVTVEDSRHVTEAHVVPPLRSLTAAATEVIVGSGVDLTVMLEEAPAVDVTVTLSSSDPSLATVAPTVAVAAGAASATVTVLGEALGGAVTLSAAIGDAVASRPLRVGGLYFSEILYDVSGSDDQREWVELFNATSSSVSLGGLLLQSNNGLAGFVDVLTLSGTIPAGGCAVVGGPMSGSGAANFTADGFAFAMGHDFATDLGNAGDPDDAPPAPGDAIQLLSATGAVLDNVIYGRNNSGSMTDEDGLVPGSPDAPDVDPGRSIERTAPGVAGPWRAQATPNPGNCSVIAP